MDSRSRSLLRDSSDRLLSLVRKRYGIFVADRGWGNLRTEIYGNTLPDHPGQWYKKAYKNSLFLRCPCTTLDRFLVLSRARSAVAFLLVFVMLLPILGFVISLALRSIGLA